MLHTASSRECGTKEETYQWENPQWSEQWGYGCKTVVLRTMNCFQQMKHSSPEIRTNQALGWTKQRMLEISCPMIVWNSQWRVACGQTQKKNRGEPSPGSAKQVREQSRNEGYTVLQSGWYKLFTKALQTTKVPNIWTLVFEVPWILSSAWSFTSADDEAHSMR